MTKQELASKIWSMADKMRSKIKANEYKDYILGFMFYKFLSDKELDFLKEQGFSDDEIKAMDDDMMEFLKENIGYAIAYDDLFSTWKAKGIGLDVKTVSEGLDRFNKNINPAQKTVFENIFNTLQNGVDKLGDSSGSKSKACRDIIDMIDTIPTGANQGYDVLGYIYEFLIYKFATAAKDDGAFYTPHEVSSLISRIVANAMKGKTGLKVYDPTSGSGGLLLNVGEEASEYMDKNNIQYYGQEKITETYHLTRMNLVMKGVPSQNITVRNGDTLEDDWPYFDDTTAYQTLRVNAVVSNPPYSLHWEPETRSNDDRFKKYGLAPAGKADYAFLLHCLYHMENDGVMAIVLPHGVLFRGDSEYDIRKNLCIEHNIETIIGLPANLFYATSIPTIIMILRKNRQSDDILFIDASQDFEKGKNQNVLRECDVKRIFDAVVDRKDIPKYAKLVSYDDIKKNDYNLNIPRYVSASPNAITFDFAATMNGAVLNNEVDEYASIWDEFKSLKAELFTDLGNGYSSFTGVDVKETIKNNADVLAFVDAFNSRVGKFKDWLVDELIRDDYDCNAKDIKNVIVDKIFEMVSDIAIIDKYDVYQLLMNNWQTIETDMAIIGSDKDICRKVEPNYVTKKVNKVDTEVQKGFKGTVIPFDLVGTTYFDADYSRLKSLTADVDSAESELAEIYEGLDDDVKTSVGDGEKFKEADLKKYIKNDADDSIKDDLQNALNIIGNIKALNKQIKAIESGVLDKIKDKIETLTDDEINDMLIAKWIEPLCAGLMDTTTQVTDAFVKIMAEMKQRYYKPMKVINEEIKAKDKEICELLDKLVGNDIDMAAIKELKGVL